MPYRFRMTVAPNVYWPSGYFNWNDARKAGQKARWPYIGNVKFKDSFGMNKNIPVLDYNKWFNEKVQHILTDESNQTDMNWFKPFNIIWRSFQMSNDAPFTNPKLCDDNKDRGHNDINSHSSSCNMAFGNSRLGSFHKVGKNKYEHFCLREYNKGDLFLRDKHGWKGCVKNGEIWDKKEEKCRPLVPHCSQLDQTKQVCLSCEMGYEKYVEIDG